MMKPEEYMKIEKRIRTFLPFRGIEGKYDVVHLLQNCAMILEALVEASECPDTRKIFRESSDLLNRMISDIQDLQV